MKNLLKIVIDILDRIIITFSIIVMLLLILLNFFDLLQRFIFGKSFSWMMDLTLLAGAWVFCLCFSVVVKRKEDIAVEFLVNRFHPMIKKTLKIFVSFAMILFSIIVVIFSIKLAGSQTHIYIYTLKPLTEAYRTIALAIGFGLTTIVLVYHLWEQIDSLTAKKYRNRK